MLNRCLMVFALVGLLVAAPVSAQAAKPGIDAGDGSQQGRLAEIVESLDEWVLTLRRGPRCPEGSTSPEVFKDWYRQAMRHSAEAFEARYGRLPAEDELLPLLPEQIEFNLGVLCNCLPCSADEGPGSEPSVAGSCVANDTTLCLDGQRPGDRRFEVRVAFQKVPAAAPCGEGQPLAVEGRRHRREGLFWCSMPERPEFLIRLADDCTGEGHFSVVWSVAQGVELTATITDTLTGDEKVFLVDWAGPQTQRRAFPCQGAAGPAAER